MKRHPCRLCGTWTCARCGWKRSGANLQVPGVNDCARCGSRQGTIVPTKHGKSMWLQHHDEYGDVWPGD
jgi:hypothetical protein